MPKRGPEIDCGTRAVIAFSMEPLIDFAHEIHLPRDSAPCCRLIRNCLFNQASYIRNGRPKVLSSRQEDIPILQATFNKEQRAKPGVEIAREVNLAYAPLLRT
jgi:hypothetical protein